MKGDMTTLLEASPAPPPVGNPERGVEAKALFREARRRRRMRWLFAAIAAVVLVVVVVVIGAGRSHGLDRVSTNPRPPVSAVASGAVRVFTMTSGAMEPTLLIGDRVQATDSHATVRRGDVIVFDPPNPPISSVPFQIKRVIGLPGDTISSSGDTVLINGVPLSEPYLSASQPLGRSIATQVIAAGHYFVLGDNRTNSYDSRYYGPIAATSIDGVVTAIIAPPSRAGPIAR